MLPKRQTQSDEGGQTSNNTQWDECLARGKPKGSKGLSEGPNSGGGDSEKASWRR